MGKEHLTKPDNDPRMYRVKRMLCSTCMWFVAKDTEQGADPPKLGRCRRHAPTMGGYPLAFLNDYCGDHRMDENAI